MLSEYIHSEQIKIYLTRLRIEPVTLDLPV